MDNWRSDGCKDGISQWGLGGKCLHGTTERFCHGRKGTNGMPGYLADYRVTWQITGLRPDLAFVTGLLGRFQSNSRTEHWKLVKKVLRYLQGMKGLMMTYRRSDSLYIVGYSDSDYARDDRKFMSRYEFTLAGGAISWKSSKQNLVHNV